MLLGLPFLPKRTRPLNGRSWKEEDLDRWLVTTTIFSLASFLQWFLLLTDWLLLLTFQILNVKPPQPLHHKSKLGLSSGNSNSSVAKKTQKEERKVYVRESAAPTPFVSMAEMMKKFQSSTRDLSLPHNKKSSLSHVMTGICISHFLEFGFYSSYVSLFIFFLSQTFFI